MIIIRNDLYGQLKVIFVLLHFNSIARHSTDQKGQRNIEWEGVYKAIQYHVPLYLYSMYSTLSVNFVDLFINENPQKTLIRLEKVKEFIYK